MEGEGGDVRIVDCRADPTFHIEVRRQLDVPNEQHEGPEAGCHSKTAAGEAAGSEGDGLMGGWAVGTRG